jgi:hypothetical protein
VQGKVTAVSYVGGQVMLSINGIDVSLGQVISIIGDDGNTKKG